MNQSSFYGDRLYNSTARNSRYALRRAGAYLRQVAKNSIRKRKRISSPGMPPSSHSGELKRFIFFAMDGDFRVVIGPEILPGKIGRVPSVLERGGQVSTRKKNSRRRELKVGMSGAIRLGRRGQVGYKEVNGLNNKKFHTAFAVIKNRAMLRRALDTETAIWGPMYLDGKAIAPRPFMVPALMNTVGKMPSFWSHSVRG